MVLGQGCVLLSIMIKKCKGMPDDKFIDFQASPAENTGDRLGADRPGTLVRSEAVELYSIQNENIDFGLKENGPI